MADLNLKAGTNMSIRQEDTDLYLDNTYEYDDTQIQQDLLTRSLITETGKTIELTLNTTTYKMTAILKDKYGNVISTSNEIDLPIESLVVSIYYDSTTKELVFVLKDGTTTRVPLLDLIDGLATEEDLQTLEDNVNNTIQTFEDDINEDMETFKGDVQQELEKAQQDLSMYKMLENALPKVEGEGENITLDNTAKCPMKLGFKGQIQQDGEPTPTNPIDIHIVSGDNTIEICGKNLLNNNAIVKGRLDNGFLGYASSTTDLTTTDDSISFTTNANYRGITTDYIKRKSDSYVIVQGTSGNTSLTIGGIAFYDKDKNYLQTKSVARQTYGWRASNNVDNAEFIRIYFALNTAGSCTITNAMVEFGDEPSSYQPYQGQNYPINLPVENLFDKDNITNGYRISATGENYVANGYYVSSFIKVKPNTNYTKNSPIADAYHRVAFYTNNSTSNFISVKDDSNTFTTPSDCQYLRLCGLQTELDTIQIEKGSKANSYTPYGTTPIEVGGIGDYEDEFFKNTIDSEYYDSTLLQDKWYLKKRIGKVVLDGSESNWLMYGTSGERKWYLEKSYFDNKNLQTPFVNTIDKSNRFKVTQYISGAWGLNRFGWHNSAKALIFDTDFGESINDWTAWLSSNNIVVCYALATPENILLNDTLQETLDSFYSWQEQTNISQENNDLPFVIKASAIYDLSNLVTRVAVLESEG